MSDTSTNHTALAAAAAALLRAVDHIEDADEAQKIREAATAAAEATREAALLRNTTEYAVARQATIHLADGDDPEAHTLLEAVGNGMHPDDLADLL